MTIEQPIREIVFRAKWVIRCDGFESRAYDEHFLFESVEMMARRQSQHYPDALCLPYNVMWIRNQASEPMSWDSAFRLHHERNALFVSRGWPPRKCELGEWVSVLSRPFPLTQHEIMELMRQQLGDLLDEEHFSRLWKFCTS